MLFFRVFFRREDFYGCDGSINKRIQVFRPSCVTIINATLKTMCSYWFEPTPTPAHSHATPNATPTFHTVPGKEPPCTDHHTGC